MHVLVTGGTGVVGKASVDRLLERGHTVRLFSRHADRDSYLWKDGVEAYPGSIARDEDVRGAGEGCDAILHVAGIVDEIPPEATFLNVNVQGTRRIVEEAERAGIERLVYVSSLGAEVGRSDYHRSKHAGEEIVRAFTGNWLICRPGNVYGPGDQVISLVLKVVRTLPVIPVIGGGEQRFQPISVEDLAHALVLAVEQSEPSREVAELAGAEPITMNELIETLELITKRRPQRLPVPEWVAMAGADLADWIGLEVPINSDQIVMLLEENVISEGGRNALTEVFGVRPTPLVEGLTRLADTMPEMLPSSGNGPLHRQRYWADIRDSAMSADELFEVVCRDFHSLTPDWLVGFGAEPGTPKSIRQGATLTMAIPIRGHIQVRVAEVRDRTITLVTLEGHHLAGMIRFFVREQRNALRFEVRSYSRASQLVDRLGMAAVGRLLQKLTWKSMVEAVIRRSGGRTSGAVHQESGDLDVREAGRVERWLEARVLERSRDAGSDQAETRHPLPSDPAEPK